MRKNLYNSVDTPVKELATLVYHHFGKAPMGWTGIDKLTEYAHNEQFVERVFDLYAIAKNSKDLILGINPSQFYKIIYKFQLAAKSLDVPVEKIVDCYLYLANYGIKTYNRNIAEIEQDIKQKQFLPIVSTETSQQVALLSALLRGFSEALYCDEHTVAGEIYSPIEMGNSTYIVRKYAMINAKELRVELENCPISAIDIFVEYQGLTQRPVTDIVGNLLITQNILPLMKSYRVEIVDTNGARSCVDDQNKLEELIEYFRDIIPKIVNGYKKMSLEERLWKKVECEYFALKPFCDVVGIDWRPQCYELDVQSISNPQRPIVKANIALSTLTNQEEILHKLIELNDPQVHW